MSDELSGLAQSGGLLADFRRAVTQAQPRERSHFQDAVRGLIDRLAVPATQDTAQVREVERSTPADTVVDEVRAARIDQEIGSLLRSNVEVERARGILDEARAGLDSIRDVLTGLADVAAEAAEQDTGSGARSLLDEAAQEALKRVDQIAEKSERFDVSPLHNNGAGATRLELNVGHGDASAIEVVVDEATQSALGLSGLDVTTQSGASTAVTSVDAALDQVDEALASIDAQQRRLSVVQRVGDLEHDLLSSARRAMGAPARDGVSDNRLDELIRALESRLREPEAAQELGVRGSLSELDAETVAADPSGSASALSLLSTAIEDAVEQTQAQSRAISLLGVESSRDDTQRQLLLEHADLTILFDNDDALREALNTRLDDAAQDPLRSRAELRGVLAEAVAGELGDAGEDDGALNAEVLARHEGLLRVLAANPGDVRAKVAADSTLAETLGQDGRTPGALVASLKSELAAAAKAKVDSKLGADNAITEDFLSSRPAFAALFLRDEGRIPSVTQADADAQGLSAQTDEDLVRTAEQHEAAVLSEVVQVARDLIDRPGLYSTEQLGKSESLAAIAVGSVQLDDAPRFVDFLRDWVSPPEDDIQAEVLIEAYQVFRAARSLGAQLGSPHADQLLENEPTLAAAVLEDPAFAEALQSDRDAVELAVMGQAEAGRRLAAKNAGGTLGALLRQRDEAPIALFSTSGDAELRGSAYAT